VGEEPGVTIGQAAPRIVGTTLDGEPFDLASYAGRPVILNFWGPTCIPCRDEFPLLAAKLAEHADDDVAIVGILTDDPAPLARDFVAEFGATWPTVEDPAKAAKQAYRVLGRPQTFFIDAGGIVRSVQIGEVRDTDFETHYARIAP
jgi:cytochrome c biogenesis protein CcmG, thiol:disulfide interchange protein DsbE